MALPFIFIAFANKPRPPSSSHRAQLFARRHLVADETTSDVVAMWRAAIDASALQKHRYSVKAQYHVGSLSFVGFR